MAPQATRRWPVVVVLLVVVAVLAAFAIGMAFLAKGAVDVFTEGGSSS